jgi:C4-dicarboxylate transporter, DctM subunit
MSHAQAERVAEPARAAAEPVIQFIRLLNRGEDAALALTLACLGVLPIIEILLRRFLHTGISGESDILQHLTLIAGMLGAMVAARQGRLLALSTIGDLLNGSFRPAASVFRGACAAAVSAGFCIAGIQFVLAQKPAGKVLAYGLPVWLVQTALPFAFAILMFRLIWRVSDSWRGRAAAAVIAGLLSWIAIQPPVSPGRLLAPALIILLAATTLGIPIFATLGGAAVLLFWSSGGLVASVSIDHYYLVRNPYIATIPLFTLAGYFLAEGGAPRRLVRVFRALFGQLPGGSAIVTALACAFFTSFTGASGVTIVAVGALLMPVLVADRYSEKASLGLVTGAGSLGLLFPPCLPLILYAIVANVPIESIFLAGILPGMAMVAGTAWWGVRQGRRANVERRAFTWIEARRALWEAKWELLLPVVALAALFGGFATPVEAAAVTAAYAFVAETVLYREMKFRDVLRVMVECGLLVGGVLLILGVARGLNDYFVDSQITSSAVVWTTSAIHSRWVFLLMLNLFLLVVGCLMDIYSAIVIQVPLLVPIARAFDVDPLRLGIIFLANLELGYLTPPVGLNLFLSSYRFNKPVSEVLHAVMPIVFVMLGVVLLITYIPWLTNALPAWFGR